MTNQADIDLIANAIDPERTLEWLRQKCPECHGSLYVRVWSRMRLCRLCSPGKWPNENENKPTGKVVRIDGGNIVWVEAWFFAQDNLVEVWRDVKTIAGDALLENNGIHRRDVPARVAGSISIIAKAIRASKEDK